MEIEYSSTTFVDTIDKQILELLKKDGKLGSKEIAGAVGLSATPTYERIKRLEKKGFIKGYIALIDKRKQGLNLSVMCNVQLKSHAANYLNEFEKEIIKLSEVTNIYHIAGNFDYLLMIEVQDMDSYAEFIKNKLSAIPHISTVQSSFVMRQIKSEY